MFSVIASSYLGSCACNHLLPGLAGGSRSSLRTDRGPQRARGPVPTVPDQPGALLALTWWLMFKGLGSREERRTEDRQQESKRKYRQWFENRKWGERASLGTLGKASGRGNMYVGGDLDGGGASHGRGGHRCRDPGSGPRGTGGTAGAESEGTERTEKTRRERRAEPDGKGLLCKEHRGGRALFRALWGATEKFNVTEDVVIIYRLKT